MGGVDQGVSEVEENIVPRDPFKLGRGVWQRNNPLLLAPEGAQTLVQEEARVISY